MEVAMSIITFINNRPEETGKTMSLVAIATNMAIENNNKILVISTTDKESKMRNCFFNEEKAKKNKLAIFGKKASSIDTENGIEGISKLIRSKRLTPEVITNYTRVIFKDRLEILFGRDKTPENKLQTDKEYVELIEIANMYYDKIFIDLDNNINEEVREEIMDKSDLIIINTSQNYTSIKKLKEDKKERYLLKSPKVLILVGRYDKYSKYNSKNITRYLGEKRQVLTIPYNTLYFEATNEAEVPDLFLKFRKISDLDDRNKIFIEEIKRASESIIYRLQELQARM
jgi:hypothetical protein